MRISDAVTVSSEIFYSRRGKHNGVITRSVPECLQLNTGPSGSGSGSGSATALALATATVQTVPVPLTDTVTDTLTVSVCDCECDCRRTVVLQV